MCLKMVYEATILGILCMHVKIQTITLKHIFQLEFICPYINRMFDKLTFLQNLDQFEFNKDPLHIFIIFFYLFNQYCSNRIDLIDIKIHADFKRKMMNHRFVATCKNPMSISAMDLNQRNVFNRLMRL